LKFRFVFRPGAVFRAGRVFRCYFCFAHIA
jgi:hypothetical protein